MASERYHDEVNAAAELRSLLRASDDGPVRTLLVMVALPVEFDAVVAHLTEQHEIEHPRGTTYRAGTFTGSSEQWRVVVAEGGMYGSHAALETERAVAYIDPDVALFVGIAGGIRDLAVGDVVAADSVHEYDAGSAEEHALKPRSRSFNSTYQLVVAARDTARAGNWKMRVRSPHESDRANAIVGPMAAGNWVLKSSHSSMFELIDTHSHGIVAVGMEGHGFLEAAHANAQPAIVIRGISDLLDDKEALTDATQPLAAARAAAFAFELVDGLPRLDASESRTASTSGERLLDHE